MRSLRWISFALTALAVAAFARYLLARQESAALRAEIALLQQDSQQVARLRAEHARLQAAKISEAELQQLRNDRAALTRLRGEISALEENAARMTSAAQEPAPEKPAALFLNLRLKSDGSLLLDGEPANQDVLRRHLAPFAGSSERVEIRLDFVPGETPLDVFKTTAERVSALGKELGVRFSLRMGKTER